MSMKTRARPWASLGLAIASLSLLIACTTRASSSDSPPPEPRPAMSIELPQEERVLLPFAISGWAIDQASREDSGIERIEVLDGGCEGTILGTAELGFERPDIADEYGLQFLKSGWQFQVRSVLPGSHLLAVRTFSPYSDAYIQCQSLTVTVE